MSCLSCFQNLVKPLPWQTYLTRPYKLNGDSSELEQTQLGDALAMAHVPHSVVLVEKGGP